MRKKCLERIVRFNSILTKKAILDKKVANSIFLRTVSSFTAKSLWIRRFKFLM